MSSDSPSHSNISDLIEYRHRMRHSASHIMADAVVHLFPEAKLAIGPPTDDGFYYDFQVSRPFTPEDLEAIDAYIRETITSDLPFQREELSREDALNMFAEQPFKLEIIDELPPNEAISIYRHGHFADLCQGPHVDSTGQISAYKLLNVAGAYWRGDEHRPMLQRIYGTAFETGEALEGHLERLEEAQRRDHRRLGRELDLFMFDPIAPASPFFLPKGAILYNALVEYIRGIYKTNGYTEVITPQIFDTELWKRSGHYEHYLANMYIVEQDEREFGVKPMNCPAHAMIFGAQLHSYRDLPVRLADFGRLHRYERSGVIQGLTRARTFVQDDAHIFCTPEQVDSEIRAFVKSLDETYKLLRFDDVRITLSLRPEERVGTDQQWDLAEKVLADSLEGQRLEYTLMLGEGAFYGPKIDFFVPDALGREWQLGTFQLDYSLPERFDLEYMAEDGSRQRPVVLHRALLGSLERFLGVLIEHYAGAFPTWLAPVQAVVIPIADRHLDYARLVEKSLKEKDIRAEVDDRSERMNAKIRHAQLQKIPYMMVVGDKETDSNSVAVRLRDGQDMGPKPLAEAIVLIQEAIDAKA
ncbi:MAG: threonine--tRNA ligase [Dehalococcoidia bacterium]|nr:threonine--tRNA ligase [Dehalococcoidia bacterium]